MCMRLLYTNNEYQYIYVCNSPPPPACNGQQTTDPTGEPPLQPRALLPAPLSHHPRHPRHPIQVLQSQEKPGKSQQLSITAILKRYQCYEVRGSNIPHRVHGSSVPQPSL